MPFSKTSEIHTEEYWTSHFNKFIKPMIETDSKFVAHRSTAIRGDIIKQIITNLITAPLVVADLTELNPNVFWELGVRQSFKHGTITIAQCGTKLPFDISSKGTLFYHERHIGNEDFFLKFKEAINSCSVEQISSDSTVLDSIVGRGSLFELVHQAELLRRMDALQKENSYNKDLYATILKKCKKNLEDKDSNDWTNGRFFTSCNELLITIRYLDEDETFYDDVVDHFHRLLACNESLRNWVTNHNLAEKWFIKNEDAWSDHITQYLDVISKARQKLMERMQGVVVT